MNILITGGNGFLGSAITRSFVQDHNIFVLENSVSTSNRISDVLDRVKMFEFLGFDYDSFFSNENIDIIVHTATCYQSNKKSDIVESNILMPVRLLDYAEKYGVKAFINTDSFFNKPENNTYAYLGEYILSKKDLLIWAKKTVNKCKFINLRLEHIYGPNDNPAKFVSYILKSLQDNEKEIALTDGVQERDFIYIDDVVEAFKIIVFSIDKIEENFITIDIGKGYTNTVREFVEQCKIETNSVTHLNFGALPQRENEIMYSCANVTVLQSLGWEAKFNIEKGIKKLLQ